MYAVVDWKKIVGRCSGFWVCSGIFFVGFSAEMLIDAMDAMDGAAAVSTAAAQEPGGGSTNADASSARYPWPQPSRLGCCT